MVEMTPSASGLVSRKLAVPARYAVDFGYAKIWVNLPLAASPGAKQRGAEAAAQLHAASWRVFVMHGALASEFATKSSPGMDVRRTALPERADMLPSQRVGSSLPPYPSLC